MTAADAAVRASTSGSLSARRTKRTQESALILEPFGKTRAHRPVDKTGNQGFTFRRTAYLAPEKAAGMRPAAYIFSEYSTVRGKKSASRSMGWEQTVTQNHSAAALNPDRAVRLIGQTPGFKKNFLAAHLGCNPRYIKKTVHHMNPCRCEGDSGERAEALGAVPGPPVRATCADANVMRPSLFLSAGQASFSAWRVFPPFILCPCRGHFLQAKTQSRVDRRPSPALPAKTPRFRTKQCEKKGMRARTTRETRGIARETSG